MEEKSNLNIFPDDNEDDRGISSEKLNEYIRFGSAGGFILIGALIISCIALLIWGFIGTIPVTITEIGIVSGLETSSHSCVCFVNVDANTGVIPVGKSANIRMPDGKTFSAALDFFSAAPLSEEELRTQFSHNSISKSLVSSFSDWMMDKALGGCSYAYVMIIETKEDISAYWHQVVQVTVVVDEVHPISFLRL